MKKIFLILFVLNCVVGLIASAYSVDFDQYMEGANYLEEYQAKQRRSELLTRGILVLSLAAGGIIVGFKLKKKD